MKPFFYLLLIVSFFSFSVSETPTSAISLKVEGIKALKGKLAILVFNKEDGFPEASEKAVLEFKIAVTSKNMEINLGALPYGNYAVALIHDANSNDVFDKNFIGIPKEAFGFTNVERVYFGPPSFKEASFTLNADSKSFKIKMLEI